MNTNYSTFNYDEDFTPVYSVFNTNTTNNRFVGIGTDKPNHFLDIIGNVSTSNLIINNNFLYNTNTSNYYNPNNIHLFQIDDTTNKVITPNLVSSTYEETGTEWTIVNNNNIKLTLRNINDNTRIHYNSIFFSILNNDTDINIYLNSSVTLKYLYITKINKTAIEQIDIDSIVSSNVLIVNNSISNTISYHNNIFKFDSFLTLSKGSHTFNIKNLSNYRIQLIGTYEYYAGSLWNKYNDITTVVSLKNVGIGTTSLSDNLHIDGNTVITNNLNINNKLTTNLLQTNELSNNGYVNVSNIEPLQNNLIINSGKNPIGIGTNIVSDFLNIFSNFKIMNNGNIILNNLHITNNINFTNNVTLSNSKSSILLNNSSNIIYKINNKTILNDNTTNLNLTSKLIINSNNSNQNEDTMNVSGNINILGDLTTNYDKIIDYNPNHSQLHSSLNTNNTIINNLLSSTGFLYTDTLDSTSIDILNYFKVTIQTDDKPLFNYPYIYYNLTTQKYMVFNHNSIYRLNHNLSLIDFSNVVKLFSNNASNITFINTDTINTNILDNNKIFSINNANITFNVNSLNEEIVFNNKIHCFNLF